MALKKPRLQVVFKNLEQRDAAIKGYPKGSYEIDKKNPLKIYMNF